MPSTKHRSEFNFKVELSEEQQSYIFDSILKDKTLHTICADLKIPLNHIYDYAFKDPIFAKRMHKIREYWMHSKVESLLTIADDCVTMVDVNAARVKSDNIKWSASKVVPEIYGDNLNINMQHSLDLSSVLLAAENRVIPILQAKSAIEAISVDSVLLPTSQSFNGEANRASDFATSSENNESSNDGNSLDDDLQDLI